MLFVFLLGLRWGGLGNHLWDEHVQGNVQQFAQRKAKPTRDQVLNDLTQRLQLMPEQQKEIAATIDSTRSRTRALYAPLDAPWDEIRRRGRANIRAVLTPDQQIRFDDFMKRLDEPRKKNSAASAAPEK